MLTEKTKEVEAVQLELRKSVTTSVKASIPTKVLELYNTYKEYFQAEFQIYNHQLGGYVYLYEAGMESKYHYLPKSNMNYMPSENEVKLFQKWHKMKEKVEVLQAELEATLLGLRTYKHVSLHLPEAVPFLPKIEKTELAIDFTRLRERLSSKVI